MDSKKSGILEKIRKIKGLEYIVIAIIALLIILILFSDGIFGKKSEEDTDVTKYVSSLERKLENALSKVKGAGKVNVVITVSGGNKTLVATDVKTIKNGVEVQTTETTVLVGGRVVVLGETFPEITGVLIVAPGAGNLSVRMGLCEAASTLLSIDLSKIRVLTGK